MNSVYFMHIPKTGGRYVRQNLFYYLIEEVSKNKKDSSLINYDHNGFEYIEKNDCFSMTILREPIKRTISHYMYLECFFHEAETISDHKDNLLSLIEDDNYYLNNYQSRFISYSGNNAFDEINKDYSVSPDMDVVYKRLSKINRVMITENISNKIINDLYGESIQYLQIKPTNLKLPNIHFDSNFNELSRQLYETLNNDEKDFIINKNYLDKEIWQYAQKNQ